MIQSALTVRAKPVSAGRQRYLSALAWAFALSNLGRVLTYLPTMWAIQGSGHSDQHSLLAWIGCMLANATMAAGIYEQNRRRIDLAVAISAANTLMCGVLGLVILW